MIVTIIVIALIVIGIICYFLMKKPTESFNNKSIDLDRHNLLGEGRMKWRHSPSHLVY